MRKPLRHDCPELLLLRHNRHDISIFASKLCDKFIYIENLTFTEENAEDNTEGGGDGGSPVSAVKPPKRATAAQLKGDTSLVALLRNAVEAASDDDGWAPLSAVGAIITKQRPDFDSRSYGYSKLSGLVEATTLFEMDQRSPGSGKQDVLYARDKHRRSPRQASSAARKKAGPAG